jgi:hypothetical protein
MGKTNYFFENPTLQPLGSFSPMVACRSSLENTWKMSLILVFNKNSPRAHTESELGVLGIQRKLVKYVVHSSKRKNWKKKKTSHKLPKQQSTSFWSQGILGVKQSYSHSFFIVRLVSKVEILRNSISCCKLFKKQTFTLKTISMNQWRLVEYRRVYYLLFLWAVCLIVHNVLYKVFLKWSFG